MCMYVYTCVYTYVYIYTYKCIHKKMVYKEGFAVIDIWYIYNIFVYTCVCMYICIHICIYIYTYIYTYSQKDGLQGRFCCYRYTPYL